MGSYILYETGRKIKQFKTWFLIVFVFILCFQNIISYYVESIKYDSYVLDAFGRTYERIGNRVTGYEEYLPEVQRAYKLISDIGTEMRIAAKEEDYSRWSKLHSFASLLYAKSIAQREGGLKEISFQKEAMKIWDEVSGEIAYDDVDFTYNNEEGRRTWIDHFLTESKYYYTLYKNNIQPIHKKHIDSITFLYIYLNDIIPIFLGFIVLIVIFDSINDEWSNGSFKLVLTQPFSREKYLISKLIAGVLQVLFIVIVPALTITIGLGFFDGFKNYNYPVLYLEKGFQTFQPLPNYLQRDFERVGANNSLGISTYSNVPDVSSGMSSRLTLTPLYKFLLLAILLLLLCIVFYVVLNNLISSITKNKIIALAISAIITLIGFIISQRWTVGDKYNLSPFTMNNPVRILNGTYNVTALTAVVVLASTSVLLFLSNILYYRRKDL